MGLFKIICWALIFLTKISYSCMDNMRSVINKHYPHVLARQPRTTTTASEQRFCNCQTINSRQHLPQLLVMESHM